MGMGLLKKKAPRIIPPPDGWQAALEASTCTGETLIGLRGPASGRLAQAELVTSQAGVEAFCRAHGIPSDGLQYQKKNN